ncbi:MAG: HlyC/CorC family transporter [Ruminiclostridium sp.]|nr:HlyC/CorC family transporter [Ruminiclostridium sp.]
MEDDGHKRKPKLAEILLFPLIILNKGLTFILKKAVGENYGDDVTEDDIMSMVDAGTESGALEDESAELISNVFDYDDLSVGDVMTHRVNISAIDINSSLDDIVYLALDQGFSRIPVYEKSIDKIEGVIIVKDLLCLIGNEHLEDFDLRKFIRETVFVPVSCTCRDAFKTMTGVKAGLAVVIDEYGGTAGIVTLEDIIESVMGNIQDEYDSESAEIKKIGAEKYEISGDADPDEVLELFGYSLPEDHDYDTVSGFVIGLLGYVPEDIPEDAGKKPHIDYETLRFVILSVSDKHIERMIVFRNTGTANDKKSL